MTGKTESLQKWKISDSLEMSFVFETIELAKYRSEIDRPLIIHSNRGSHYTSEAYKSATEDLIRSYSKKGYPYDNAGNERKSKSIVKYWTYTWDLHNRLTAVKQKLIRDNYRLGDDIQSKVLAFTFGLSAEIERNLISQSTKEVLDRRKAEGVKLGRPKEQAKHHYLDGTESFISLMLESGMSFNAIAKAFGVSRTTLKRKMEKSES